MSEESGSLDDQLPLDSAADKLRRARTEAGLSIEQIAAETRIPIRHLQAIERGDYAALPSRTYAIGFARSFADNVGLDDTMIAEMVRSELGTHGGRERQPQSFEPGDPTRLPSRGLAWVSAAAALLLIVGGLAYFRDYFIPGSGPAPLVGDTPTTGPAPAPTRGASAPPVPAPQGQVVFTALEDSVWVKFYDADGQRLMEKQMAKGESYAVPAAAKGPQIWTGQPEALQISVGGKAIGRLSDKSEIVRDVPVTAPALVARAAAAASEG